LILRAFALKVRAEILLTIMISILAAWVHRGYCDDVTEKITTESGRDLLTEFQKDKFRHFFFHVLDLNSDSVISNEDFDKLNEVNGN